VRSGENNNGTGGYIQHDVVEMSKSRESDVNRYEKFLLRNIPSPVYALFAVPTLMKKRPVLQHTTMKRIMQV